MNASAKIFGGSHFPGSISYSTTFNSSGNFNLPGLANYTTHGDTETLAVTWGVHLENLPSLNLSFSDANNDYSIYGANAQGRLHSETFSATSAYRIAGFNLNGGYQYAGTKTVTPEFLAGEPAAKTNTGANSFFFGVGHNLPWNGNISAGASRLDLSTNLGDTTSTDKYNTSIDTLTGALNFAPATHLNVGANTYYTDNLEGTLYNTLLTAGVIVPESEAQQSSHDLSLTGYANYEMPAQHLNLHAFVERQQQTFLGISFASDSYNGTATYSNTLLGGQFNGVLGVDADLHRYDSPKSAGPELFPQLHASDPALDRGGRLQLLAGYPDRADQLYDLRLQLQRQRGPQDPPKGVLGRLRERRQEPVDRRARVRQFQPELLDIAFPVPLQH